MSKNVAFAFTAWRWKALLGLREKQDRDAENVPKYQQQDLSDQQIKEVVNANEPQISLFLHQ